MYALRSAILLWADMGLEVSPKKILVANIFSRNPSFHRYGFRRTAWRASSGCSGSRNPSLSRVGFRRGRSFLAAMAKPVAILPWADMGLDKRTSLIWKPCYCKVTILPWTDVGLEIFTTPATCRWMNRNPSFRRDGFRRYACGLNGQPLLETQSLLIQRQI